ncbi:MAG: hypothetical protein ACJZ7A_04760 [Opitutales bacterium]
MSEKFKKQIINGNILINLTTFPLAATFFSTQDSFISSDPSARKMRHKAPYSS